ncbi:anthrone oxygenase family protein [Agromyces sp. NPDC056523]|uniref:anthrone oxygenase family protein n=1 Tax=Agromyces sp. NPDC056523 TaxID=3345850 RepID=UPI0036713CEC
MGGLMALTQLVSLLLVGVIAGMFVATQIGQVRVQRTLGARDFTLVKHSFEVAVGRIMPVLVIAAGVSIVPVLVLSIVTADRAALVFSALALALWAGAIVVTLMVNVPVNRLAAEWDPESPPSDWVQLRDRWHLGQTIRTPMALASFVCLGLGMAWPQLAS